MGIVSEVRLNLQELRWCFTLRLSLPESGGKALAEEKDREMCYMLHCPLKVSLCTTYLVEVNKLKRITRIFTSPLQRTNSLHLCLCSS